MWHVFLVLYRFIQVICHTQSQCIIVMHIKVAQINKRYDLRRLMIVGKD
jgi:hypothetical protein